MRVEDAWVPDGRTQALVLAELARRMGFHVYVSLDDGGVPELLVSRMGVAGVRWRRRGWLK